MGPGIQIYNNSGGLQITDTFKNLQFVRKGSVTIPNNWLRPYTSIQFSPGELVAFRIESASKDDYCSIRSGSSDGLVTFTGYPGKTLEYYAFSYKKIPTGNYFEVRNLLGEVVFSDAAHFMKVLDAKRGTTLVDYHNQGIVGNTIHDPNKKTAVLLGARCWNLTVDYMETDPGSYVYWNFHTWRGLVFRFYGDHVESETIEEFSDRTESYGWPTVSYQNIRFRKYDYLVLDVTDIKE